MASIFLSTFSLSMSCFLKSGHLRFLSSFIQEGGMGIVLPFFLARTFLMAENLSRKSPCLMTFSSLERLCFITSSSLNSSSRMGVGLSCGSESSLRGWESKWERVRRRLYSSLETSDPIEAILSLGYTSLAYRRNRRMRVAGSSLVFLIALFKSV